MISLLWQRFLWKDGAPVGDLRWYNLFRCCRRRAQRAAWDGNDNDEDG